MEKESSFGLAKCPNNNTRLTKEDDNNKKL
jgi:hypothetical protein